MESDPRDLSGNTRVAIWKTSLAAWREFPVVGSGLGTFREAFRRVQPRELKGLVEQAHNDFLQLAVTGGAVGAALGVLLFGSLFVLLFRAWLGSDIARRAPSPSRDSARCSRLTLHGLVEFNLSIPIIPATLACALGAAWAAARRVVDSPGYLRGTSNGTATVIQAATDFPPFRPGSKSHCRTAATAAWSRSGCTPRATSTREGSPLSETRTFSRTIPPTPARCALAG